MCIGIRTNLVIDGSEILLQERLRISSMYLNDPLNRLFATHPLVRYDYFANTANTTGSCAEDQIKARSECATIYFCVVGSYFS